MISIIIVVSLAVMISLATIFFKPDSSENGVSINIPALLSGSDFTTDVPLFAGYRIFIPTIGTAVR